MGLMFPEEKYIEIDPRARAHVLHTHTHTYTHAIKLFINSHAINKEVAMGHSDKFLRRYILFSINDMNT